MINEYRYFLQSSFAGFNILSVLVYSNKDDDSKRFNPLQTHEAKSPSTIFPPVTSTDVGDLPKNFLSFTFNPFAALV